jgi:purine nucleoside phosphorylase
MGMETAVISCVANLAAGMSGDTLTEEEVMAEMQAASGRLGGLIYALIRELENES